MTRNEKIAALTAQIQALQAQIRKAPASQTARLMKQIQNLGRALDLLVKG